MAFHRQSEKGTCGMHGEAGMRYFFRIVAKPLEKYAGMPRQIMISQFGLGRR